MIALLLACQSPEDSQKEAVDYQYLAEAGPYAVGYHTSSVTYPDPAGTGDRNLRLALWYPTEDSSGEAPAYDAAFEGIGAYTDASVAPGSFPLIVYSHGHQVFAENSGFLMEHLASQGFIVAAPDHTGDTLTNGTRSTEIYYQRPHDISAVMDVLLDEGDFVAGHVAEAPVVAIGHSFGGYTMLALAGAGYDLATLGPQCTADPSRSEFCSNWSPEAEAIFAQGFRDERINTVIEMGTGDYSLFGAAGVAQVAVPVLHQTGSLDEHTPVDGEAYWQVLQGGLHRRLQIEGATHATFTDFSGFYDATVEGRIDVALGFDIINAYSYAWVLRAETDDFSTALGEEAPFLDGSVQTWAEAEILK